MSRPRVLITGGTGFIGYEVARQLAEAGYRPRLLVRRMSRGLIVSQLDAEPVVGDLTSPESLARAAKDCDIVLHLAGRATFEEYDLLKRTIYDGATTLCTAAAETGVKAFVFASSLLVYDDAPRSEPIDRSTPASPRSSYGRLKLEAEAAMAETAKNAGMAFCALRLPHVYGARDAVFESIREGGFIMPGLGENLYAHLHVYDAARGIIEAGLQGYEGVTPMADDEPVDWNTFFGIIRTYYPRLRLRKLPAGLARMGTYCLRPIQRLRGRPALETPDGVQAWNLSLPVKAGILWDDLGLELRYPTVHEGIPAALDDCVAWRWLHPIYDRS